MAGPLRGWGGRGGGVVKGRAIKENYLFLELFFQGSKVPTAIKLEGGVVKP